MPTTVIQQQWSTNFMHRKLSIMKSEYLHATLHAPNIRRQLPVFQMWSSEAYRRSGCQHMLTYLFSKRLWLEVLFNCEHGGRRLLQGINISQLMEKTIRYSFPFQPTDSILRITECVQGERYTPYTYAGTYFNYSTILDSSGKLYSMCKLFVLIWANHQRSLDSHLCRKLWSPVLLRHSTDIHSPCTWYPAQVQN